MTHPLQRFSVALLLAASLAACSTSSPDVIGRGDAQRLSHVEDAVVLTVRTVTIDGNQSGVGAAVGGITGAVAGATRGGSANESGAIGLLVGVAGAVAGNAIERMATREDAIEVLVQLKNGERRSVVQGKGDQTFAPGDRVTLVTTGGKVRVIK